MGKEIHVVKRDCFAYICQNGGEECSALNGLYCRSEECKFYKSKMEMEGKGIEYPEPKICEQGEEP